MYLSVTELTQCQLDELKTALFWGDDPGPLFDNIGLPALFPGDIDNNRIFLEYAHISFVPDDFCCNCSNCPDRDTCRDPHKQ